MGIVSGKMGVGTVLNWVQERLTKAWHLATYSMEKRE